MSLKIVHFRFQSTIYTTTLPFQLIHKRYNLRAGGFFTGLFDRGACRDRDGGAP